MKNNNSKKIFEGLISRTKIYLVLIAILLAVICILDLRYFTPSVVFIYTNFSIYVLEQPKKKDRTFRPFARFNI